MQSTVQLTTVVGVFEDRMQAQRAVSALKTAGFLDDQIGVAYRGEESGILPRGQQQETSVATGAATGAAGGAGIGALWALGIAAGILPAIGPVVAGGILGSLLASAATGAVAGGLAGALIGIGVPDEEAQYYEDEFKAGRIVVSVKAPGRSEEAATIMQRFGAYNASIRHSMTH